MQREFTPALQFICIAQHLFFQYSLVFFSPPPHRINRKVKPDQTRCAELYPIYLFLMTLSLKGELRFSLFFLQKDWRSDLRFQTHHRYRSGDLNGATTKKKIFNWAADTISDLMAEFPLQQQQENTHTHTYRLVNSGIGMVVASLPVLQLIILKAVFYQDPFLLFLNPPSLTQVLLAPKTQTTVKHQQERKNKRCLVALWHRREPKDRCFMVVEHFYAKNWL